MRGRPEPGSGMTLIVKTVCRLTLGLILIYGAYIILHGETGAGGGFAGGVVIALALIHLVLAFGRETGLKGISRSLASFSRNVSAPALMSLSMLGFLGGWAALTVLGNAGRLTEQTRLWIISYCDIFIGVNVAVGLFAIFLVLLSIRVRKGVGE